LARLDNCAQPTMSAAVSSLVKNGLAAKQANPDDARGMVVTLTDAGRQELVDRRTVFGATVLEHLVAAGHTEAELATAVALLRDLLDTTSEGNK
jgi:DNA-binding MarR family transcriptional regulator